MASNSSRLIEKILEELNLHMFQGRFRDKKNNNRYCMQIVGTRIPGFGDLKYKGYDENKNRVC